VLRLKGLNRCYATEAEVVWAVRDVNLEAQAGDFVVVFGASGSGKSTLLNLVSGLDDADSGVVEVGSTDVTQLDETGRSRLRLETVGVVFQEHQLVDEFTAVENVALPLEARGVGSREAFAQAAEQLSRVGLAGLEGRLPHQLSGGQRQRVGIARALVGERRILLADEPTGALDSEASMSLFRLIRELCHQGLLALVCSHDPDCRAFADTVYEMVDGRLSRVLS